MKFALGVAVLAVFIILALRCTKRPGIALALVWSMFGLEQILQVNFPIFLQYSWAINVGVGFAALIAVLGVLSKTNLKVNPPKQMIFFGLLMGLCCLSLAWCPDYDTSFDELKKNFPLIVTFCLLAPLCVYRTEELQTAVNVMVCFGALVIFAMLFVKFGNRGFVVDYVGRKAVEANSLAASQFAGYVGICAVFSIYSGGKNNNTIAVIFKVCVTLVAMYLIIRSSSRGQLIAFIATCFFWLPIAAKMAAKRSTILALIFSFGVIAAGILTVGGQFSARWEIQHIESARDGRLQRNVDLIWIYLNEGPLAWMFGLGSSASFEVVGGYPHNVPVETLTEEGLFGFALLTLIIGYTFKDALSTMRMQLKKEASDRINSSIVLALFTYDFMLSMKQGTLLGSVPMFSFAITVGLMTVLRKQQKRALKNRRQQYPHHLDPGGHLLGTPRNFR